MYTHIHRASLVLTLVIGFVPPVGRVIWNALVMFGSSVLPHTIQALIICWLSMSTAAIITEREPGWRDLRERVTSDSDWVLRRNEEGVTTCSTQWRLTEVKHYAFILGFFMQQCFGERCSLIPRTIPVFQPCTLKCKGCATLKSWKCMGLDTMLWRTFQRLLFLLNRVSIHYLQCHKLAVQA